jgi:hypothetical protein
MAKGYRKNYGAALNAKVDLRRLAEPDKSGPRYLF